MKYIESGVFQACKSLKRVTVLGDGLEIIGQEAFAESGIKSFVAPSSLRELKEKAFAGCSALKHVDLGACTF